MLLSKNFPTYPQNIPQTLNQQFMIWNSCIICRIKVRCKLAGLVSELGFSITWKPWLQLKRERPSRKNKKCATNGITVIPQKCNTWKLKIKFVEKGDSELEKPIIFPASIGKNSERISWGFQYYLPFTLSSGFVLTLKNCERYDFAARLLKEVGSRRFSGQVVMVNSEGPTPHQCHLFPQED